MKMNSYWKLLMVSQDLGMHSCKLFVPERKNYNLIVFGKKVFKEKQE
jgi:hypothetical protein